MNGRERLMRLREVLCNVPKERFDIRAWASPCGSTACAIGWGCVDPVLNKEGLHFNINANIPTPIYHAHYGFDAVQVFFGMDADSVQHCFSPYEYKDYKGKVGPLDVVKRIDRYLETHNGQDS
jgi:hypothetical protein